MVVVPASPMRSLKTKVIKLSSFSSLNSVGDKERRVDIINLDFTEPPDEVLLKGNVGKYGLILVRLCG